MNLNEALRQKRDKIIATWVDRTLDSYASSTFFKEGKDRFANPVGGNIREGLSSLYELLTGDGDAEAFAKPLDQVIRIRAVQEFTPGQAVAPILELKWVVRSVFATDKKCLPLIEQLQELDLNVDRAALKAFDIYVECREQVYKGRIRELKSGSHILTDSRCPSRMSAKE